MNRPFDFKWTWLDDEGKPLAGKVEFCKLHTTVLENIYDNQGYPAENPIFTEVQTGQLVHQVFLKDKTDYTVRWYKYVGNGDMTEDQDNWLFLYSADVLWDVYGVEFETDAYQVVDNIAALRTTEPEAVKTRDSRKVVLLGGYYQLADKPTVMYVWNPYSIASDNGGDVIKVDTVNTGRWELVNHFDESGVDVRHFGVFGADGISDATDAMSLAIGIASNYAASINRPLYFPSNEGNTWYKVNNLNISGAIFAKGTKVFGNTGTASRITVRDQDTYLDVYTNVNYKGVFTIAGDVVRTSWGVNSTNCIFEPELKLIVDSPVNTNHKDWADIIVDVLEPIDHVQFTHCQLNAIGTVGDWSTFINMKVTEAMFQHGVSLDTITVFDNDVIDLSDFPTTATWFSLVGETSQRVFDFQGRTVDSTCENGSNSAITYRNAVFSNYTAQQGTINFDNCRGTVVLGNSVQSIYTKDCPSLALGGTVTALANFVSQDSTVAFGRSMTVTNWNVTRTSIEDAGIVHHGTTMAFASSYVKSGLSVTTLNALDTGFYGDIAVVVPTFIKCDFYDGTVYQNNVTSDPINFVFRNCNFYSGGGHHFSASVANTLVIGEWTGNYSALSGHFITFDRTNIDPDEQHHTYLYSDNSGPNVLQKLSGKWKDVVYTGPNYPGTGDTQGVLQNKTLYFTGMTIGGGTSQTNLYKAFGVGYRGRQSRNDEHGGGTTLVDYYLTEFQMFSIGTHNVGNFCLRCYMPDKLTSDMVAGSSIIVVGLPSKIVSTVTGAMINEVEKPWYSSQTGALGWPKGIMFYSGYTWRITFCEGMCLLQPNLYFPSDDVDYMIPVTYTLEHV